MNKIEIKNCGLTKAEHVIAAKESGATYVGFVHEPASPRHLSLEDISPLLRLASPEIYSVILLVNPSDETLEKVVALNPDFIQLHGQEAPERVAEIRNAYGIPLIKACGVKTAEDIETARNYELVADILLLDAKPPKETNMTGGHGVAFDWNLLSDISFHRPWFLAGGLDAANVAEAVRISGASAVDVSSGIELQRGEKDATKIAEFNRTVKAIT